MSEEFAKTEGPIRVKYGWYRLTIWWNARVIDMEVNRKKWNIIKPILNIIRRKYNRIYLLTNDEEYRPDKDHRHLTRVAGNIEKEIFNKFKHEIIPFEYWNENGPIKKKNAWSYLFDLGNSEIDMFQAGILGNYITPIDYVFFFCKENITFNEFLQTIMKSDYPYPGDWELNVLKIAGAYITTTHGHDNTIITMDNELIESITKEL